VDFASVFILLHEGVHHHTLHGLSNRCRNSEGRRIDCLQSIRNRVLGISIFCSYKISTVFLVIEKVIQASFIANFTYFKMIHLNFRYLSLEIRSLSCLKICPKLSNLFLHFSQPQFYLESS
jgi:hypothetical protein